MRASTTSVGTSIWIAAAERLGTDDLGKALRLLDGAREAVHQEPVTAHVALCQALLDHPQHHRIGDEVAMVDEGLHLEAEWSRLGHLAPKDLAGRDVVNAQVGCDAMADGPLARALATEDDQLGETAHSRPPGA